MVSYPNKSEQERLLAEITRAPLKEAIFDVRVQRAPTTSLQTLEGLPGRIAKDYPTHKRLWKQSFTLQPGNSAIAPAEAQGFICHSQDEKQVVQFGLDGFTFSRLRPYSHWDELLPQVKDLWELYVNVATPSVVTRVANRYINVIEFPEARIPLDDYFTVAPRVPDELPQDLKEFLYRVVFQFPDDITAIVTQANQPSPPSPPASTVAVLLDIDVFRSVSFAPTDSRLWKEFDQLHEARNGIFLQYLQPRTLDLFK